MKIKEIEEVKKGMGEIEFYRYFYYDGDDEFMEENIEEFRESEKIIQHIYKLLEDDKKYNVKLNESGITVYDKNKKMYSIRIEF